MKITMKRAWVGMNESSGQSDAKMDIEGVGEITILEPLPIELKQQIEAFYIGVYHERMAQRVVQNPETLKAAGEDV